ncbi:MAG: hypothetical protein ABFD82_20445 [Syntrophaceae bacterium]
MKDLYKDWRDEVEVDTLPNCLFCGKEAGYNAKTDADLWCYLCDECFLKHGCVLGPTDGQMLVLKSKSKEASAT